MEPKEIATIIAQNFRPDVRGESVGGVAWAMARDGKLGKSGSLYFAPSRIPASSNIDEATQDNGTNPEGGAV